MQRCLCARHGGTWRSGGTATQIFNLQTRWGAWAAVRPYRFTLWQKIPGAPWTGGWEGPRVDLDALEKKEGSCPRPKLSQDSCDVQPVAWSLYKLRFQGCVKKNVHDAITCLKKKVNWNGKCEMLVTLSLSCRKTDLVCVSRIAVWLCDRKLRIVVRVAAETLLPVGDT